MSSGTGPSSRNPAAATTTAIVDVYPLSHDRNELNGRHVKTIHIVRHAQGTHNVKKEYRDIRNLDARLTDYGREQCANLAKTSPTLVSDDAVVVSSPLTRCIQTSLHSFPHLDRFLAHENIRETVNYTCDRRRVISDIQSDHPEIDFSHVDHHHDAIWDYYEDLLGTDHHDERESAQLYKVAERARTFLRWLQERPEQEIVLCSHEAFLRCILNWGQKGGVPLMPRQDLDDRGDGAEDVALFRYCGTDNGEFEGYMRRGFNNCELRSFLMAFPTQV